jgi:hypothetical protein
MKNTLTSYVIDDFCCDRCKQRYRKKCYHHAVCDSVNVRSMLEQLDELLGQYYEKHGKTYPQILLATKLCVDHMQVDRENDLHHIDYAIPSNDIEKQRLYTQFIAREYNLRGLRLHGTQVEEWRCVLQNSIVMELLICMLQKVRNWQAEGTEKVPLVEVVGY